MGVNHVFIIGSKGIPAKYGGFETFVEKLTEYQKNKEIKYHVACLADNYDEFTYNNARCFNIKVPRIGAAKAVIYDLRALRNIIRYIKENDIKNATVYILAARIGPFIKVYKKILKKLGCKLWLNPDGHEWKRAKWNVIIKKYWKLSEKLMVKNSDLIVCDSKNIEKYIKEEYKKFKPNTIFISYGADYENSKLNDNDEKVLSWYRRNDVKENQYYLVVGRFVPENNYEIVIKEFMKSKTKKDLVIVTNISKNKFYEKLKESTFFYKDKRIKFVGTVYDQQLLKKIRENAYCYIHGHEVGGTNPSLLESLAMTKINLLLDVGFNREVAMEGAIYFSKDDSNLSQKINNLEFISIKSIKRLENAAKNRVINEYNWERVTSKYEGMLCKGKYSGRKILETV